MSGGDEHVTAVGKGRAGGACAILVVAALALAGCQTTANDGYPSPFGPSRPTPLPAVAGGGLWTAQPVRPVGFGVSSLISRLPPEPQVAPPARSAETPELLTRDQQIARERALRQAGDDHGRAMDERLRRRGRVGAGAR